MTMLNEQAWLTRLRAAAGQATDRDEQIHVTHGRVAGMAWQIVSAGASASGKRLLVVEIADASDERIAAALRTLADDGDPPRN